MNFRERTIKRRLRPFPILLMLFVSFQLMNSAPLLRNHMPYRQALSREIAFWKLVFTRYSQEDYILHDSENLTIIYKVVTFDSTLTDRQREQKLKAIKKDIKKLLLRFHTGKIDTTRLDSWERYVYEQFRKIPGKKKFLRASRRIRTQQGIRENFVAGITRSYAYLPYLKKIFREEGVPEELIYLPHVESSFNPHAVSHVGAVGMWQFMRRTARQFMKINRVKDERFDPLISTRAAARLLKRNYNTLHDWALAITAYNHGLSGMKRARRRYGNYLKIRDRYLRRSFGFASKNFYPEFLAVVDIMDSLDFYFPDIARDSLFRFQKFKLPVPIKITRLAEQFQLDIHELKRLNPGFRIRVWRGSRKIPAGYTIRLPLHADADKILAALEAQRELVQQTLLARRQELEQQTQGEFHRNVLTKAQSRVSTVKPNRYRPLVEPGAPTRAISLYSRWLQAAPNFPVIANVAAPIPENEWLPETGVFGNGTPHRVLLPSSGESEAEMTRVKIDWTEAYPLSETERELSTAALLSDGGIPEGAFFRYSPVPDVAPVEAPAQLYARVSFPTVPGKSSSPVSAPDEILLAMTTNRTNGWNNARFDLPPAEAPAQLRGAGTSPHRAAPAPQTATSILAEKPAPPLPQTKTALLNVDGNITAGSNLSLPYQTPQSVLSAKPGVESDYPIASENLPLAPPGGSLPFLLPQGDFYDPFLQAVASAPSPGNIVSDSLLLPPLSEDEYSLQEIIGSGAAETHPINFPKIRVIADPEESRIPLSIEPILVAVRTSFSPDIFPMVSKGNPVVGRISPKPGVEGVDANTPIFTRAQPPRSGEAVPLAKSEISNGWELEMTATASGTNPQWFASKPVAFHGVLNRSEIVILLKRQLKMDGNRIKVMPKETLGHFSEWLGISIYQLRRLNHLSRRKKIYTGQELVLDFSHVTPARFFEQRLQYHLSLLEKYLQGSSGVRLITHRVQKGENLWNLAHRKYKFPVNLLLYFNDFDKLERLFPGDVINLPVKYN